jgi:hypothetical protein
VEQSPVDAYFWEPHLPTWQQALRSLDSASEAQE